MKLIFHIIIGLLPIALFSQTTNVLSIKVYDTRESNAVKNARVEVEFEKGFEDDFTDSDGVCNFILNKTNRAVLAGEEVTILVYKEGYETLRLDYTIQKNADRVLVNFTKEAKISVLGYVLDGQGKPIEGAKITYLGNYDTYSLSDGYFQLNIPLDVIDETSSQLIFTFTKEGFDTERVKITLPYGKKTVFIEHSLKTPETSNDASIQFPYNTQNINGLIWMSEDLSTVTPNSFDAPGQGRLYTWEAAKKACEQLGEGWRLPTEEDWRVLALSFGGYKSIGVGMGEGDPEEGYKNVMSSPFKPSLNGLKLPFKSKYRDQSKRGYYWTDTTTQGDKAVFFGFSEGSIVKSMKASDYAMSCRCIKNI